MSKARKHPSARAIEKMGYATLLPKDAKELLGSEGLIQRVVAAIYGESRVKKAWITDTFDGANLTQFLEPRRAVVRPEERRTIAVCPNGAYAEAFFVDLDNGQLDYLVVIEQEKRRPFGERPSERAERERQRQEAERLAKSTDPLADVRAAIEAEGFDYAFRNYSPFDEVKDTKFHRLRHAYVQAAEALEKYLEE